MLAWGLRGLRGGVRAPSLEVQCGGRALRTPAIADLTANPNFPINTFLLTLVRTGGISPPMGATAGPHRVTAPLGPQHLPAEEEYVPPIRLRVLDTRGFGYWPEVGQSCVQGLGQYRCPPRGQGQPPSTPSAALPASSVALPRPGMSLPHPWYPLPHP